MQTPTDQRTVCEIRNYSRQEIEGGVLIRYEVRQPGAREWVPVKIFRPSEVPA